MPTSIPSALQNCLLRLIPAADMERMYRHFEWVDLDSHEVLQSSNQPIKYIYFPVSGIYSVLTLGKNGDGIETGLIGHEGMIGAALCFDVHNAPFEVLVQVPGRSIRIADHHFLETFNTSIETRTIILRYVYTAFVQTAQTAFANGCMTVQQRLARWLLMCQDRLETPEFEITHQFLARTLAVQRPMVTVSLQILEGQRAIRSTRGKVKIIDRALLEDIAGSAYGVAENEYVRLLVNPQFEEQVPAGPRSAGLM